MSLYPDIESRVVALLQAGAPGAAVYERGVREAMFAIDKLAQGFRSDELPAIQVTAQREPTQSTAWTHGETAYAVPLEIYAVCRAIVKDDAQRAAIDFQWAIERALNAARSASGFGLANTMVDPQAKIASTVDTIESKPHHFAAVTVKATVLAIREV